MNFNQDLTSRSVRSQNLNPQMFARKDRVDKMPASDQKKAANHDSSDSDEMMGDQVEDFNDSQF